MKSHALALSAGGALGLSHIGVLKAFHELGFKPSHISGTSMGAIIAATYSLYQDPEKQMNILKRTLESKSFSSLILNNQGERKHHFNLHEHFNSFKGHIKRWMSVQNALLKQSFISFDQFYKIVCELVPDINIEDMPLPFSCACTNISEAKPEIITKGSLRDAIYKSAAIQAIVEPFKDEGKFYVDGTFSMKVPVPAAKAIGAKRVIAINVDPSPMHIERYNPLKVLLSMYEMQQRTVAIHQLEEADHVIDLVPPKGNFFDYQLGPWFIEWSYRETLPKVKKLLSQLEKKKIFRFG